MARYQFTPKRKSTTGKEYYKNIKYPDIPLENTDIYVITNKGDRFDTLAQRYYEDSNLWWIIAKANEIGNGKISPNPEVKLRIPTEIDDILESIDNSN